MKLHKTILTMIPALLSTTVCLSDFAFDNVSLIEMEGIEAYSINGKDAKRGPKFANYEDGSGNKYDYLFWISDDEILEYKIVTHTSTANSISSSFTGDFTDSFVSYDRCEGELLAGPEEPAIIEFDTFYTRDGNAYIAILLQWVYPTAPTFQRSTFHVFRIDPNQTSKLKEILVVKDEVQECIIDNEPSNLYCEDCYDTIGVNGFEVVTNEYNGTTNDQDDQFTIVFKGTGPKEFTKLDFIDNSSGLTTLYRDDALFENFEITNFVSNSSGNDTFDIIYNNIDASASNHKLQIIYTTTGSSPHTISYADITNPGASISGTTISSVDFHTRPKINAEITSDDIFIFTDSLHMSHNQNIRLSKTFSLLTELDNSLDDSDQGSLDYDDYRTGVLNDGSLILQNQSTISNSVVTILDTFMRGVTSSTLNPTYSLVSGVSDLDILYNTTAISEDFVKVEIPPSRPSTNPDSDDTLVGTLVRGFSYDGANPLIVGDYYMLLHTVNTSSSNSGTLSTSQSLSVPSTALTNPTTTNTSKLHYNSYTNTSPADVSPVHAYQLAFKGHTSSSSIQTKRAKALENDGLTFPRWEHTLTVPNQLMVSPGTEVSAIFVPPMGVSSTSPIFDIFAFDLGSVPTGTVTITDLDITKLNQVSYDTNVDSWDFSNSTDRNDWSIASPAFYNDSRDYFGINFNDLYAWDNTTVTKDFLVDDEDSSSIFFGGSHNGKFDANYTFPSSLSTGLYRVIINGSLYSDSNKATSSDVEQLERSPFISVQLITEFTGGYETISSDSYLARSNYGHSPVEDFDDAGNFKIESKVYYLSVPDLPNISGTRLQVTYSDDDNVHGSARESYTPDSGNGNRPTEPEEYVYKIYNITMDEMNY